MLRVLGSERSARIRERVPVLIQYIHQFNLTKFVQPGPKNSLSLLLWLHTRVTKTMAAAFSASLRTHTSKVLRHD